MNKIPPMNELRDDATIKRAMVAYEVLIYARHAVVKHGTTCTTIQGCRECVLAHERWKQAKDEYMARIRDMIG